MNTLIDPSNVIKYDRTDEELELFWLFCIVVAGKTAKTQARLLSEFLNKLGEGSPFERIRRSEENLEVHIKWSRLGQWTRITRAFRESARSRIDLRRCPLDDLEAIHGVGPKTARMFLMFTRPNTRVAALDTHVLKHLKDKGVDVPKATPPAGKRYRELEQAFIKLADEAGMKVADYDLMIWKRYSK